jgi:hypothetical protein
MLSMELTSSLTLLKVPKAHYSNVMQQTFTASLLLHLAAVPTKSKVKKATQLLIQK